MSEETINKMCIRDSRYTVHSSCNLRRQAKRQRGIYSMRINCNYKRTVTGIQKLKIPKQSICEQYCRGLAPGNFQFQQWLI